MIKNDIMLKCSDLLQPGSRWSHLKTTRMKTAEGIFIRANDRYAEEIIRCLGLKDSKPAPTPMTNDCVEGDAMTPLSVEQTRMYRHVVGVLRFLVLFRYDLSFPCKILSEGLQKPTEGHWAMAKRLGRYLKGTVEMGMWFPAGGEMETIEITSDSNWAGCKSTRRSTSSGTVMVGGCLLMHVCRNQSIVAQSSAEAEIYAMASITSEAILIQRVLEFFGYNLPIRLGADSSAARAVVARMGVGRIRHLEVKVLWLQQLVKDARLVTYKIDGQENPADVGTKVMSAAKLD